MADDTFVVAYDDYDHIFAGRLAWALRYAGHEAVRVLDGGWSRWSAEGRPTTREVPRRAPAIFTPQRRRELRRTADEVAAALGRADVLLVDARAPEQYAGLVRAAGRGGHIPGAKNVPYARLIEATTGRFLSDDGLRRVFAESGIDAAHLPREVIVYCNGGVSCTVPLNALRILGRDDVAVYDGSWNEWGNDDTRPAEVDAKGCADPLDARGVGSGDMVRAPATRRSRRALPDRRARFRCTSPSRRLGAGGVGLAAACVTAGGVWAAEAVARDLRKKDPQVVVIDEVAGLLVTMLAFDHVTLTSLGAGFVVFRLLDALKPGPIRWLEKWPGGWGIVMDDVGAGAVGAALLFTWTRVVGPF